MRLTLVLLLWILLAPLTAAGQSATNTVANEKFHATPGGVVIANLMEGASLQPGAARDSWREVTLEGWIWAASVRPDQRPGFDLVVSAAAGENLRVTPNGDMLARLESGTLLVQVRREGRWVLVRRVGWVRGAALAGVVDRPATVAASTGSAAARPAADKLAKDTAVAAPGKTGAPDNTPVAGAAVPPVTIGALGWTGQAGARLLSAPGGDTLASIRPLAALEVIDQQGEWTRVQVEGWVRTRTLAAAVDSGTVLTEIAPEVLLSNPEGFRGLTIEWQVQFIAFDRAERIRTDFTEGQLFILARPPGDQPGFVYLIVPDEHLARVQALTPLQRITVLARVRTGRSPQMGAPILDLLEIR